MEGGDSVMLSPSSNSFGISPLGFNEFKSESMDLIITLCDQAISDSCPIFPGQAKKLHSEVPFPHRSICCELHSSPTNCSGVSPISSHRSNGTTRRAVSFVHSVH